jgi:hypothetical protein
MSKNPNSLKWHSYSAEWDVNGRFGVRFKILFDAYRNMVDQSYFKSKDLGDMLRFLPGVEAYVLPRDG